METNLKEDDKIRLIDQGTIGQVIKVLDNEVYFYDLNDDEYITYKTNINNVILIKD